MSYSLDDVLPQAPRAVEGGLFAWILWGHAPWVAGLTWAGLASERPILLTGALAHVVALFLAVLAWIERGRSAWGARVVAWMSTTLLGLGSALCAAALVASVAGALSVPAADPDAMEDMSSLIIGAFVIGAIVSAVVAIPTVGGFIAAISLARDLRRS